MLAFSGGMLLSETEREGSDATESISSAFLAKLGAAGQGSPRGIGSRLDYHATSIGVVGRPSLTRDGRLALARGPRAR